MTSLSDSNMFQFHEGPIKTISEVNNPFVFSEFQFHEGPIKTAIQVFPLVIYSLFQFHEGPIKTPTNRAEAGRYLVSIP